jgi:two-component system cell cycle response regulator
LAVRYILTGLHNRRYLDTNIPVLLTRAMGRERPLSVIMLDFDHFKRINDQYGHDAGDDVLREFATRLRKNIRGMDLMCRYGGEEFVVVLPDSDVEAAKAVAERIRVAVSDTPFAVATGKHKVNLTISMGVAGLRLMGDSADALFSRADAALYQAKKGGRNRIVSSAA